MPNNKLGTSITVSPSTSFKNPKASLLIEVNKTESKQSKIAPATISKALRSENCFFLKNKTAKTIPITTRISPIKTT